jgi:hypothetical protein
MAGWARRDHYGARIMTSYPVVSENLSELREAELNEVSGGADVTILGVRNGRASIRERGSRAGVSRAGRLY